MRKAVKIEKLGGEGVGIAHIDGKTVFVPLSVPGDDLYVNIFHETTSYFKAEIVDINRPSEARTEAPCPYFGECGGCAHQNIKYLMQLKYKHDLLKEVFRKITSDKLSIDPVVPSPEQFGYRNKLQMQCTSGKNGKVVAGFYRIKSHDVVDIDKCPLHSDNVNKLVETVVSVLNQYKIPPYSEKLKKGMVRHIVVRESRKTGEMLLTIVSNHKTLFNQNSISKTLFKRNKNLKGFFVFHNPHDTNVIFEDGRDIRIGDNRSPITKVFGEESIIDSIDGVDFRVSPISFFQVNTAQATNMARHIEKLLVDGKTPRKTSLVDAYSGIGTLSLGLSPYFTSVMAVEIVAQACTLAKLNAKTAGALNYNVRRGDVSEVVGTLINKFGPEEFRSKYGAILLDPPRAGLSDEMTDFLCEAKIAEIVYVSCNPMTQARDVEKLVKKGYVVTKITPFDMFPHTFHIENIMKLEYRGE